MYVPDEIIVDYLLSCGAPDTNPYGVAVSRTAAICRQSVDDVTRVAEENGLYTDEDLTDARDRRWTALKYDYDRSDKICEGCGEKPGQLTVDPYSEDIDNLTVYVVYCEDCVADIANDV